MLNNFDDYLTAASLPFTLTNALKSPKSEDIKVVFSDSSIQKKQELQFNLKEKSDYIVEYRCMFLPDNSVLVQKSFTEEDLENLETQIVQEIDTDIQEELKNKRQEKINSNHSILDNLNDTINANLAISPRTTKLDTSKEELELKIKAIQEEIDSLEESLKNSDSKTVTSSTSIQNKTQKPGFFFNRLIAENVTDANYSIPVGNQKTVTGEKINITLPILDNTTDNFGNPLIIGNDYIPVILSVASL